MLRCSTGTYPLPNVQYDINHILTTCTHEIWSICDFVYRIDTIRVRNSFVTVTGQRYPPRPVDTVLISPPHYFPVERLVGRHRGKKANKQPKLDWRYLTDTQRFSRWSVARRCLRRLASRAPASGKSDRKRFRRHFAPVSHDAATCVYRKRVSAC